ncbi:MAG: hypothetical protein LBE12_09360 [Planctomycetaceae bacterium]|nr:hypothetical protein [Planctomycetaceae bacterium]
MSAIFVPLCVLIIDLMICAFLYSAYYAGTQAVIIFLFSIISGFVIYFSLKRKLKKTKNRINAQEEEKQDTETIRDTPNQSPSIQEAPNQSVEPPDTETENTLTPEQQQEADKKEFMDSLPKNEKGEVYRKSLTLEQGLQFLEYKHGREFVVKAAQEKMSDNNKTVKVLQEKAQKADILEADEIQDQIDILIEYNKVYETYVRQYTPIQTISSTEIKTCTQQMDEKQQAQKPKNSKIKNWEFVICVPIVIVILIISIIIEQNKENQSEKTVKQNKTVTLNYEGLSFSYPEDWTIEKTVIYEDFAFQVVCTKGLFLSEIIAVTWIRMTELSLPEIIEEYIEGLKEEESHKNSKFSTLYNGVFKGQNSLSVDFVVSFMGLTNYGTITSFIMNGNAVTIVKQSNSKEKLATEFKIIEESINIKNPVK